jgi:hypothetical protein
MTLKFSSVFLLAVALTGCGNPATVAGQWLQAYYGSLEPKNATIMGDYPVVVENTVVKISGYDRCPVSALDEFLGILPNEERDCIAVNHDSSTVRVQFALKGDLHREIWTVTREKGLFGLKRANGEAVYAAGSGSSMRLSDTRSF